MDNRPWHDLTWDDNRGYFTVTDLKQYIVCPRIVYYHTVLPKIRPITGRMALGSKQHLSENQRSARRIVPGIEVHKRFHDYPLVSHQLGLTGKVDELLVTDQGYIPVDYKFSTTSKPHFRLQVVAYAMMIEEIFNQAAPLGFIYLIRVRKWVKVQVRPDDRKKIMETLISMHDIAQQQIMPDPTHIRAQCRECEFIRFCNDVI